MGSVASVVGHWVVNDTWQEPTVIFPDAYCDRHLSCIRLRCWVTEANVNNLLSVRSQSCHVTVRNVVAFLCLDWQSASYLLSSSQSASHYWLSGSLSVCQQQASPARVHLQPLRYITRCWCLSSFLALCHSWPSWSVTVTVSLRAGSLSVTVSCQ